MAFTTVTVTHTFQDGTGAALSGSVVFKLTAEMTNGTTTLEPTDIVAVLNSSGAISQALLANDDTGTTPTDTRWQVFLRLNNAPQKEFTFILSKASAPSVDLWTLIPSAQQVN